jgi:hypothetical protein
MNNETDGMYDPHAPAGWYVNPDNHTQERYWDGTEWSQQTRPHWQPAAILGGSIWQGVRVVHGLIFVVPTIGFLGFAGFTMISGGGLMLGGTVLGFVALFTTIFVISSVKQLRHARRMVNARNASPDIQAALGNTLMLPDDIKNEKRWAPPYIVGTIATLCGILTVAFALNGETFAAVVLTAITVASAWGAWHTFRLNRKAGLPVEDAWKTGGTK